MLTALRPSFVRPAVLAAVILAAISGPARADLIDETLLKNSAKIMRKLGDAGYKNVGVLKFQVKKGAEAPSYFVGRLNTLMATRLENVLILANDPEKPIGITRSASNIAAQRDKDASYDSADARAKLFEGKYPLAWGKNEVTVDAFLSGMVEVSPDYATTKVTVSVFDPKNLEPRELLTFSVATSRLQLADLNQKFFVTKRELNGLVKIDETDPDKDKVAEKQAQQVPKKLDELALLDVVNTGKPNGDPKAETLDRVLEFKMFYDGKEVQRGPDLKVATPREGQKIHFTLKSTERLGVVLRINGVNTMGAESDERDPTQYSMWVLKPNMLYTIDGFYREDGTKLAIKVLPDSESTTFRLADETKRGKIELYLFREVEMPVKNVNLPDVKFVTFRQPLPTNIESVEAAQNQVLAMKGPREKSLAVPGAAEGKTALKTVPFSNVELTGAMTITYFEAKR